MYVYTYVLVFLYYMFEKCYDGGHQHALFHITRTHHACFAYNDLANLRMKTDNTIKLKMISIRNLVTSSSRLNKLTYAKIFHHEIAYREMISFNV